VDEPTLGERIRLARLALSLTQAEVAASAEIACSSLQALEYGKALSPRINLILRLSEILEVSPGWLAFGE